MSQPLTATKMSLYTVYIYIYSISKQCNASIQTHALMPFWNKHGVFEVAPRGMEHDISAKNAPLTSANASEHLERMLLLLFSTLFSLTVI